jgi:hypothetical protein
VCLCNGDLSFNNWRLDHAVSTTSLLDFKHGSELITGSRKLAPNDIVGLFVSQSNGQTWEVLTSGVTMTGSDSTFPLVSSATGELSFNGWQLDHVRSTANDLYWLFRKELVVWTRKLTVCALAGMFTCVATGKVWEVRADGKVHRIGADDFFVLKVKENGDISFSNWWLNHAKSENRTLHWYQSGQTLMWVRQRTAKDLVGLYASRVNDNSWEVRADGKVCMIGAEKCFPLETALNGDLSFNGWTLDQVNSLERMVLWVQDGKRIEWVRKISVRELLGVFEAVGDNGKSWEITADGKVALLGGDKVFLLVFDANGDISFNDWQLAHFSSSPACIVWIQGEAGIRWHRKLNARDVVGLFTSDSGQVWEVGTDGKVGQFGSDNIFQLETDANLDLSFNGWRLDHCASTIEALCWVGSSEAGVHKITWIRKAMREGVEPPAVPKRSKTPDKNQSGSFLQKLKKWF